MSAGRATVMALWALLGCRQDMHDQPRYRPLRPSPFFADGLSARQPVPGTVPRGSLHEDTALYTGKVDPDTGTAEAPPDPTPALAREAQPGATPVIQHGGPVPLSGGTDVTAFPVPIGPQTLLRGQERFEIFCSPCHGRLGNGASMVVRRGVRQPPSFHDPRLRGEPVGHFFDVISNGYGAMMPYAAQVPVADRWAIIAYIRALQLSQHATLADVPAEGRAQLGTAPGRQGP